MWSESWSEAIDRNQGEHVQVQGHSETFCFACLESEIYPQLFALKAAFKIVLHSRINQHFVNGLGFALSSLVNVALLMQS